MNKPRVSVVMPVYNAEKFIRESIDSVLDQSFRDLELICVDDGSTDSSPRILEEYRSRDERLRIIRQENQFAGIARNNGLDHAEGEYVMFLDSDDVLEKDAVSYLIKNAEKNHTDVIVFGYYRFTDSIRRRRPVRNNYKNGMLSSPREIKDSIFQITRSMPWDKFIRTDFLKGTGIRYQKMRVSEDIYVNRAMVTEAERILFTHKRLINYRVGNADSLQGRINRYPAEFLKGNEALYHELVKKDVYTLFQKSFERIVVADMILHLKAIDSFESFKAVVDAAAGMDFWNTLHIDASSEAVSASGFRETMEAVIAGDAKEGLAKLLCEMQASSVSKNAIEYQIGHKLLKALRLVY